MRAGSRCWCWALGAAVFAAWVEWKFVSGPKGFSKAESRSDPPIRGATSTLNPHLMCNDFSEILNLAILLSLVSFKQRNMLLSKSLPSFS